MKKSLVLLYITCAIGTSYAQVIVTSPLTEFVSAYPGNSAVITVEVYNSGKETRTIVLGPSDYSTDCEKGYIYEPPGTLEGSCAEWLSIERREFILDPGDREKINVRIYVPEGYNSPSAHACLFVSNEPVADTTRGELKYSFGVRTRYAINILYTNLAFGKSLTALKANQILIDSTTGSPSIIIRMLNEGNNSDKFTTTAEIVNEAGEVVYNYTTPEKNIQPGQCRNIRLQNCTIPKGNYQLILVSKTKSDKMFGLTQALVL